MTPQSFTGTQKTESKMLDYVKDISKTIAVLHNDPYKLI